MSELVALLGSDADRGLSTEEATRRLLVHGPNRIRSVRRITFLDVLWEELREPLILLLLAVGVVYSLWGSRGDAITIFSIILLLVIVEVSTEYRAKRNIESLRRLSAPATQALRDGVVVELPVEQLVPGDLLLLRAGNRIAADARVITSHGLAVDESPLTGESGAVYKSPDSLPERRSLAERANMLHLGSVITRGRGKALVTSTGMRSELGRIAALAETEREPKSPLQVAMKQLSVTLVWIALAFSAAVPIVGLLRGLPFRETLLTGFALAFATIPEELPIIITMVLGLSALKLARRQVLFRRLRAAESLGSVSVIATDKTGTLTENRMHIASIVADDELLLLESAVLMADEVATGSPGEGVAPDQQFALASDPMDRALLRHARERAIDPVLLRARYELIEELDFDPRRGIFAQRYRAAVSAEGGAPARAEELFMIKGAPESVMALCRLSPDAERFIPYRELVNSGARTIAFARSAPLASPEMRLDDARYELLGLVSFDDPVRAGVRDSIAACQSAGIRVVMLTGDHAETARSVARAVGLEADGRLMSGEELDALPPEAAAEALTATGLFARITPVHKLAVVRALRAKGEVVAVTGDGVNDAPALKAADIGIAMGESGTDVAREAADMVLLDDSFTSVVAGVREGRRLFDNLSKCVKYYLSCKLALVALFVLPLALGLPFPFAPVQIILLELFMDLAASTSFVAEPEEPDLVARPPRNPNEPFMGRTMMAEIGAGAATLALAVAAVYLTSWYRTGDLAISQSFAFLAWLVGHLLLALNMRSARIPILRAGVFGNRAFNVWIVGIVVFTTAAFVVPALRAPLRLAPLSPKAVLVAIGWLVVAMAWPEVKKWLPEAVAAGRHRSESNRNGDGPNRSSNGRV